MRVKCFAQEHNTMTRQGLEPGLVDPESSALTSRPPHIPHLELDIMYKIQRDTV